MIITGYQGIGKSTLAKTNDKIIDLESSCFWKYDFYDFDHTGEKSRPNDWHVYYCQIAQHLSKQGYTVFVSCHPEVRKFLDIHNEEHFCAIFPDKSLKKEWIQRLRDRYKESKSEKDLRALEHAEKNYDNDVYQLWCECQYGNEYYYDIEIIKDINYNLEDLVKALKERELEREINKKQG